MSRTGRAPSCEHLTRDDFTILEDGLPQDVTSFAVVDLPPPQQQGWRAASLDELVGTARPEALLPGARVYALLLDMAGWVHNPSRRCQRETDHVRRVQLLATRHVRTASVQFRRTEQLPMEWPTRGGLPASARLLDRTGAPMRVPLAIVERRDDEMTWLVVDVPVAALAPGEYVVEVGQGEAMRLTPFRVVP